MAAALRLAAASSLAAVPGLDICAATSGLGTAGDTVGVGAVMFAGLAVAWLLLLLSSAAQEGLLTPGATFMGSLGTSELVVLAEMASVGAGVAVSASVGAAGPVVEGFMGFWCKAKERLVAKMCFCDA